MPPVVAALAELHSYSPRQVWNNSEISTPRGRWRKWKRWHLHTFSSFAVLCRWVGCWLWDECCWKELYEICAFIFSMFWCTADELFQVLLLCHNTTHNKRFQNFLDTSYNRCRCPTVAFNRWTIGVNDLDFWISLWGYNLYNSSIWIIKKEKDCSIKSMVKI